MIQQSLKQRSHSLGYALNSTVTVPFCPECHSYPCSCDDNIIHKHDVTKPLASMGESNCSTLRYTDIDSRYG